jgi:hypothetical protein
VHDLKVTADQGIPVAQNSYAIALRDRLGSERMTAGAAVSHCPEFVRCFVVRWEMRFEENT